MKEKIKKVLPPTRTQIQSSFSNNRSGANSGRRDQYIQAVEALTDSEPVMTGMSITQSPLPDELVGQEGIHISTST